MNNRWDEYFLGLCLANAKMSKDPNTQVGSVVVGPDNELRASGFNGFPRGIDDAQYRLKDRETKNRLMVHAERNCICSAARVGVSLKGCTLYLACTDETGEIWGGPPCTPCTIEIIQAGITNIVSRPMKQVSKWREDLEFARNLLREANIDYREVRLPTTDQNDDGIPF